MSKETPRTVHPPEWPDKVMFAAMLQVIGGALGALFALLQLAGLRIDEGLAIHLAIVGPAPALVLSLVTIGFGLYGIRHQASVWVWVAIGCGILSVGMLGVVPIMSLVALGFLLRSRAEGEETKHDARIVHPSRWPDKALAASLLLFAGALVSLAQAYMVFADMVLLPTMLRDLPMGVAAASLVAGAWSLYASFEIYRVRRAWVGYVAVALNVVSVAFLLLGPALAVATFVLLQKARGEDEFEGAAAA